MKDTTVRSADVSRENSENIKGEPERVQHQLAALEQLFEVYERTALEQATKLELLLEEQKRTERELRKYKSHLEELVEARTQELSRINEQLQEDIAVRKTVEKALTRKTEELARSNAELEQFAYVASHDLQEPLRMVASYTQMIARRYRGKLDADADEFIGYAVDGATRMQNLIRDLLSYSRLTTQGSPLEITEAKAACESAIKNLQKAIEERNGTVNVGPLPAVRADATQLTQLFQNLVGNGLKYCDKSKPVIQISAKPNGDEWIFSVQDNGIGIDPKYFERIFQMFQRLHTREEYPGTGIGLALCRKIVDRHGGRIWVESEAGHGATFLFTIPKNERSRE